MAVAVRRDDGAMTSPAQIEELWKERIRQARDYRKQFEPTWLSNLAFAAGQMWLAWDKGERRMRHLSELDPRYADRELYTNDRINEQRQAQLGELSNDDDRPQLLTAQQGDSAESITRELNNAVAHGWDHEWEADAALQQARSLCLDLGVSAIRCRFDPTLGPAMANVPVLNGRPVTDPAQARELMAGGPRGDVEMRTVHEGRTVWEPVSAFGILAPPGVNHEKAFPWEIIVRPVLLEKLVEEYGPAAEGIEEDRDIASMMGLSTSQRTSQVGQTEKGRLRGFAWLFTCYTRPNRDHPDGQVAAFASNQTKLLALRPQLPYVAPDGTRRSGIRYFHWWRLNDRFYSRAFIEPMKDPQRLINRRETQNAEIIDRGMPKVFTKEGDLKHNPRGLPLENIEMAKDAAEPNFFAGIGPGQWMYQDIDHHIDNLAHASTLSPLRLGENPTNVDTYAQLALLNENEAGKRTTILGEHKLAIAGLVEDSVWDIREYWPEKKLILVTGDEDQVARVTFEKSRVPDFYIAKVAKGATQPRSQGAELTKVDAIWTAAETSGLVSSNPDKWVRWYVASLDAGQALDLPEADTDSQTQLAAFENYLIVHQGLVPQPADYDLAPVHIPIHREAQDQARAAGDAQALTRLDAHIQLHIRAAQINAAKIAGAQQTPSPIPTPEPASSLAAAAAGTQSGPLPLFPPQLLPPAPASAAP